MAGKHQWKLLWDIGDHIILLSAFLLLHIHLSSVCLRSFFLESKEKWNLLEKVFFEYLFTQETDF